MDDLLVLEQDQTGQELAREAADERDREAGEVVRADEFVEVDRQTGRDDA